VTNRMVCGQLGSGDFGIRVSRPGYDVLTEPLGSTGISFDSRLTDIGTVIAAGLIACGGSPVYFPTMNYVPIVKINFWDGNLYEDHEFANAAGGTASSHRWYPAIGVVTTNSLSVIAYPGPTFNPVAFYNPNGQYYLYSIFAVG
jgi:hypothetical protein